MPKLYGQTEYPGTDGVRRRALFMSDIGGIELSELEVGSLPLDYVEMMKDAFQALVDTVVGHGDPKLDNMHVVRNKIMLIDFDTSYRIEDGQPELWVLGAVNHALRMYKNRHELHRSRDFERPLSQHTERWAISDKGKWGLMPRLWSSTHCNPINLHKSSGP